MSCLQFCAESSSHASPDNPFRIGDLLNVAGELSREGARDGAARVKF